MKKHLSFLLAMLAALFPGIAQNTFPVHFSHGTEIFPENFATIRQTPNVTPDEVVNGVYTRYIQLEKIMNNAERASFESTGAKVIGYVTFGAYLVQLPQNFDYQSIAGFSPRSVVPVKPEWKLAKSLREQPYGSWAAHGDFIDVNIQVYPSLSIADGAALCRKNALDVLKEGTQNGFVQLRIHKDKIAEVAALSFVQYLELVPPPSQKDDTRSRSLHRTNLVDSEAPMGKKYNGEGVNTLIRDDGDVGPHIDFKGRLDNGAVFSPGGTHGDYTAGCLGAAGNLDPTGKGMASGAYVYVTEYFADFQDVTVNLIEDNAITITNTSYTDGFNAGYTINAQTVDQQLYNNPNLTHVFSAGNANDDGVDYGYGAGTQWGNISGGHKLAKNALTVASLQSDGTLSNFSSRGPATDGRLKPDIAGHGEDVFMPQPDNTYDFNSGTSFSAPSVAGCLAQLTQAFRTINNVADAPSALLKAVVYNTANDLGNVGPDYKFGWGHINTWRALRLMEENRWLEGNVDQGGVATHSIQIPAGTKEAKIMIYWADPPAMEGSAKTLINDLDLSVKNAAGTESLSWKLNTAPNPVLLDTPAGKGRDSLNNVEQVLLENPAAGNYTVNIKGFEVPMGPQHYYLVWEFIRDEIKITYPAGGEGFVPGEVERIHWEAYGNTGMFTLRYSADGGNTFSNIANVTGDKRIFDWTVPNTISGKVYIMAIRGAKRDTTDFPCSIVRVPQDLQVLKVCPDSITLGWTGIHDTLSYDGYVLGNKYMELRGTTDSNSVAMPINSGAQPQWLSVRASHPNGLTGRRALAIYWPGGLLSCPQSYDLALNQILNPAGDVIISCGNADVPITLKLINEGQNIVTGATAFYQVDNQPAVSEIVPDIPVGASLDFTFQTPFNANFNGSAELKTWVVFPNDVVDYNDTIVQSYTVVSEALNQPFLETFEGSANLPLGWAIINPDGNLSWQTTDGLTFPIVGPDDLIGRSMHLDFFDYGPNQDGEMDYLYLAPFDLSTMNNPSLTFQVAYARYDDQYNDALRVDVFTGCDLGGPYQTVWEKSSSELATISDQSSYYYAGSGSDWRTELVDLSGFAGQKIVVRFTTINGYGNSLYLDNIGILSLEPPIASFVAPDTICRLDTIIFMANPSTPDATYFWSFGSAAQPSTGAGIGPHVVVYPTLGNKTVRLIVNNSFGADTLVQSMNVRQLATANFTVSQNLLTATFTNTSTSATSYLWDFGDGMTSTETSPVHTYAAPGTYAVKLSATNPCRTHTKTTSVGVTAVNELADRMDIRVLPNPTAGDFAVEMNSQMTGEIQLSLFDAAGRKVANKDISLKTGATRVSFENMQLPKGLYQLKVQSDNKVAMFSIAVQ